MRYADAEMSDLFRKLNLKGHASMLVLDAPASFDAALAGLDGVQVRRTVPATGPVVYAIAFATTLAGVERLARDVVPRLEGDAILWCAYPKGSSKRYTCDFNRDTGWASLRAAGFESVRQVAIDEDWSALPVPTRGVHRDSARPDLTAARRPRARRGVCRGYAWRIRRGPGSSGTLRRANHEP